MFHEPKHQVVWLSKNVMHFKVCQVVLEVENLADFLFCNKIVLTLISSLWPRLKHDNESGPKLSTLSQSVGKYKEMSFKHSQMKSTWGIEIICEIQVFGTKL
jgi:hypothetical protein